MTTQTKITDKAVRLILFICLVSIGAVVIAKQVGSADIQTVNAVEPTGRSHDRPLTGNIPGQSATQLETARENGKQQAAEAAFALSIAAMDRMDVAAAQTLIQEALQLQPSNPGYLQAAAGLAFYKGDFVVAQAYQVQSLELALAALGPGDIRVAMLMDDLGTIYLARQNYVQAEHTWQSSLTIYEQVLGKMHPAIAPRLNDLAGLAMYDGRFDETEELLKRAIDILDADADTDRTDIAIAQHNLADFYIQRQRPAEADELYRKALADWKAIPMQQRLQIADSLNKLGDGYLEQRRPAEAKSQYELVIELLKEESGPDHPYVRSAQIALDKLNSEQSGLGESREFDQKMFEELRSQFSRRSQIM